MAHTERDLETPRLWLRPMLADRQRIPALPNKRVEPSEIVAILAPGFGSTAFPIYRCGAAEAQGVSQTRGEA